MEKFNHKIVRDLAWLIGSESMVDARFSDTLNMDEWCSMELDRHKDMLHKMDLNPPNLTEIPYLGKYFEELFEVWMSNSPHYQIILKNQQLFEDGKTITEIDFIIKSLDTNDLIHFETSVKIYLGYDDTSEVSNWIGPNSNDSLGLKLSKVYDLQLETFNTNAGKDYLKNKNLQRVSSKLFMKGHLHRHVDQSISLPEKINRSQDQNLWIHAYELNKIDGRDLFWCLLPKRYWLSDVVVSPNELPVKRWPEIINQLQKTFNKDQSSVMLCALSKIDGMFYQTYRLMVVADSWPA